MKLRSFLMFFIFIAGTEAFALNFNGRFFRSNGNSHVQIQDSDKSAPIFIAQAASPQVESTLRELKSFDMITGTGTITKGNILVIETIDFVALRRLIGVWENPTVRVNFLDFQNVTIDFWNRHLNLKAKYNYAVSPGRGNSWRMYFTDNASVTLGVLTIDHLFAQLDIFDPETGEIAHTYQLQKALLPFYAH